MFKDNLWIGYALLCVDQEIKTFWLNNCSYNRNNLQKYTTKEAFIKLVKSWMNVQLHLSFLYYNYVNYWVLCNFKHNPKKSVNCKGGRKKLKRLNLKGISIKSSLCSILNSVNWHTFFFWTGTHHLPCARALK